MNPLRVVLEEIEPRLLAESLDALLSEEPEFNIVARSIPAEALLGTASRLRANVVVYALTRADLPPTSAALLKELADVVVIGVERNGRLLSVVATNLPLTGILATNRGARKR